MRRRSTPLSIKCARDCTPAAVQCGSLSKSISRSTSFAGTFMRLRARWSRWGARGRRMWGSAGICWSCSGAASPGCEPAFWPACLLGEKPARMPACRQDCLPHKLPELFLQLIERGSAGAEFLVGHFRQSEIRGLCHLVQIEDALIDVQKPRHDFSLALVLLQ